MDYVLFTKWDRFSRNAGDAYQMISTLRNWAIEPQAIEQPLDITIPENKLMLAIYLSTPEVENDRRALNVVHGVQVPLGEQVPEQQVLLFENEFILKNKKATRSRFLRIIILRG